MDAHKFFVPLVAANRFEEIYLRVKQYVQSQSPYSVITNRRIFRLVLEHNGTLKVLGQYILEVGKPVHDNGETVIAIFEIEVWYLICTKSRGALKDVPTWIDGQDVVAVVEFSG